MCQVIVLTVEQILKCWRQPDPLEAPWWCWFSQFDNVTLKFNPSHGFCGDGIAKDYTEWHRPVHPAVMSEEVRMHNWKQDFIHLYLTNPYGTGADFVFSFTVTVTLGNRIPVILGETWLDPSLTLWFLRHHYVWNNSVGIISLKIVL